MRQAQAAGGEGQGAAGAAASATRPAVPPAAVTGLPPGLPAEVAAELARLVRRQPTRRGTLIHLDGDPSDSVGFVLGGVLKQVKSTEDGREQIVGLAFPGDFFGRPFAPAPAYSLVAATDGTLAVYPRTAFERVLAGCPALEHALLLAALAELDNMRGWMLVLGRTKAEEKIACFLLQVARRFRALDDGRLFELPLTRGEIADAMGTTIGTVSRELTELKTAGVVELRGARGLRVTCARTLMARTGLVRPTGT